MLGAGTLAVGELDAPRPLNAASAATAITIKLTTRTPLISSNRRAAGRATPGHGRLADTFDADIKRRTLLYSTFPTRRLAGRNTPAAFGCQAAEAKYS
jgi:hypothetical protein